MAQFYFTSGSHVCRVTDGVVDATWTPGGSLNVHRGAVSAAGDVVVLSDVDQAVDLLPIYLSLSGAPNSGTSGVVTVGGQAHTIASNNPTYDGFDPGADSDARVMATADDGAYLRYADPDGFGNGGNVVFDLVPAPTFNTITKLELVLDWKSESGADIVSTSSEYHYGFRLRISGNGTAPPYLYDFTIPAAGGRTVLDVPIYWIGAVMKDALAHGKFNVDFGPLSYVAPTDVVTLDRMALRVTGTVGGYLGYRLPADLSDAELWGSFGTGSELFTFNGRPWAADPVGYASGIVYDPVDNVFWVGNNYWLNDAAVGDEPYNYTLGKWTVDGQLLGLYAASDLAPYGEGDDHTVYYHGGFTGMTLDVTGRRMWYFAVNNANYGAVEYRIADDHVIGWNAIMQQYPGMGGTVPADAPEFGIYGAADIAWDNSRGQFWGVGANPTIDVHDGTTPTGTTDKVWLVQYDPTLFSNDDFDFDGYEHMVRAWALADDNSADGPYSRVQAAGFVGSQLVYACQGGAPQHRDDTFYQLDPTTGAIEFLFTSGDTQANAPWSTGDVLDVWAAPAQLPNLAGLIRTRRNAFAKGRL